MTAKAETKRRVGVLESELEHLKRVLGLGYELRVEWLPGQVKHFREKQLSGEVLDGTIYIYEWDDEKALVTLRHEFLDYAVCQVIKPYKSIANKLISATNEGAYRKKEKLIERLSCLRLPDEDADWGARTSGSHPEAVEMAAKAEAKR